MAKEMFSFRIEPELKQAIEDRAKRLDRPCSYVVIALLKKSLKIKTQSAEQNKEAAA